MPGRNQRPQVGVVETVPEAQLFTGDAQPLDQFILYSALDQQARAGRTDLTAVGEYAFQDIGNRALEVGVGHDDMRRFAAQFEGHRGHVLRSRYHYCLAGGDRAGKGDVAHVGMFGQRLAGHLAITGDDIDDPWRHPDRFDDFADQQRGQRRILGRLDHRRVTAGQRRRQPARTMLIGTFHGRICPVTPIGTFSV